jgi:hypothetical protein
MPQLSFRPAHAAPGSDHRSRHLIEEGGRYLIMVVEIAAGLRYTPAFCTTDEHASQAAWDILANFLSSRETAEEMCQQHADRAGAVEEYRAAREATKAAKAALEAADEAEDAAFAALRAVGGSVTDLI